MLFGKCRICQAKDSEIASLKQHLADLRALVLPKATGALTLNALEQDAVISGSQDQIKYELSEEDKETADEAARILSANY